MTWPLTPWMKGNPARPGFYLTRVDAVGPVVIRRWSGTHWWINGMKHAWPSLQFAGLAFDPVAVERIIDAECYPQRVRYLWVVPAP